MRQASKMTRTSVRYSVLMSVYRCETPAFFVQSAESMFAQTLPPDELVLVVDGPVGPELDREIERLCNRFPARPIRLEQHVGLAAALNAGLAACQYELVARMDSDDWAVPTRMACQLDLMQRTGAEIVSAQICEFIKMPGDLERVRRVPLTEAEIRKTVRRRNPFNHPAVVYRKSTVLALGGYRDYPGFEDYELFARAVAAGVSCANAEEILLYMRVGAGLYRRRGGRAYIRQLHRFYRHMRALSLVGTGSFWRCELPRIMVALLPDWARAAVYRRLLRTSEQKEKRP